MREAERKLTPDMLKSQLEIEFCTSSSENTVLNILKQGKRIAFIVMDRTRIVFGSSNLHTALEYELGINERADTYIKAEAQMSRKELKVRFTSESKRRITEMYGVIGDGYYDYTAVIEMKVKDYLNDLLKKRKT